MKNFKKIYLAIIGFHVFCVVSCQAPDASEKKIAVESQLQKNSTNEPDCAEKAKAAEKVEIKAEAISLSNPDAGCSLDTEKSQKPNLDDLTKK
jgi:hypothetical protein